MGELIRKMKKSISVWMLFLLVFMGLTVQAEENTNTDYKVEQVYINMPDVTAYYRSPNGDGNLEAYLGGEKLSIMENMGFSETGEAVEYYVLLDISASIRSSRFEDIKASLQQFNNELRENDQLILLTFGDAVQNVLAGGESKEQAAELISQLQNRDQNTVLFEAIDQVADQIVQAGDTSEKRRIVIVISDGKDCADDTRSVESVQTKLIARGIPLYTVAVENNEGDSETEISNYRGKFAALARNTGGIPCVAQENGTVLDGLNSVKNAVMNSYRVKLKASSNKVTHENEDFVLKFLSAGNMSDTCSVLVSRNQSDTTAPQITSIVSEEENVIKITFSEPVENADTVSNYSVKKDAKSIPVNQVRKGDDGENAVLLIFSQELYEADYSIKVSNVTDASNEANPLENPEHTLRTTWQEPTEAPTEPPIETEPPTEPESETEEEESVGELILKWWPIVLTVVVVILIIIIIVIVRKIKKKKGVLIIDDHIVDPGQVDIKQHVGFAQSDNLPKKNIVLWISNGVDEPKRMEVLVNGSAIVGRSTQCDVYCDDPMMSRQHFVLEVEGVNLFVTDLQTKNGTNVNGVEIKDRYRLNTHDEIMAGSLKFRVEWQE